MSFRHGKPVGTTSRAWPSWASEQLLPTVTWVGISPGLQNQRQPPAGVDSLTRSRAFSGKRSRRFGALAPERSDGPYAADAKFG